MSRLSDLHKSAMEYALRAELARRDGDHIAAGALFAKSFSLEREAAMLLEVSFNAEPTRSVLFRSAASLALDCKDSVEAITLIDKALEGTPPEEIAHELRELRLVANAAATQFIQPTSKRLASLHSASNSLQGTKKVRITRRTPLETTPPFNRFFDRFPCTFHALLEERKEVIATGKTITYAAMPDAEAAILNFARSRSSSIGLIVGPVGIGKSSVLKHLRSNVWESEGSLVLFSDFSQETDTDLFPGEYWLVPLEQRQQISFSAAAKVISSLMQQYTIKNSEQLCVTNAAQLYTFVQRFFPSKLPATAMFSDATPDDCLSQLQYLAQSAPVLFSELVFVHLIHKHDIRHIILLFDNVDHRDILFLTSLASAAAHIARIIHSLAESESHAANALIRREMTPLIACRPQTAAHLTASHHLPGHGWFGIESISVHRPASLSEIISKRYNSLKIEAKHNEWLSLELHKEMKFNLRGKSITLPDRKRFFVGICNEFQRTGQLRDLMSVCNNNVADAMGSMMEVIRNVHFVHGDALVEDALSGYFELEDGGTKRIGSDSSAFTRTSVIRALAYGNQGSVSYPMYPIRQSRIPNIIDSEHARFGDSVLKPRILDLLLTKKRRSTIAGDYSFAEVMNVCVEFGLGSHDQTQCVIDELYDESIITHGHGMQVPSSAGDECRLEVTPRGEFMQDALAHDSILLQCYRDAVFLDQNIEWQGVWYAFRDVPTLSMSIAETFNALLLMVVQAWRAELRSLEMNPAICERFSRFTELFGGMFVAERMLSGLRGSINFYLRRDSRVHQVVDLVHQLQEEIDRWTHRLS